jgi:hypothetical protein
VAAADRAVYPPPLARVPVRLPNPSTLTQGEEDDEDVDATAAAVTGDRSDRSDVPPGGGTRTPPQPSEPVFSTPAQSPLPRKPFSTAEPVSDFGRFLLHARERQGLGTPDGVASAGPDASRLSLPLGEILQMEIDDDADDAELAIPDVAISSAIKSARGGGAAGAGALDDFTAADEALRASARSLLEDPTHVSMEINIAIPEVALDLTYDVALAHHLVLAVRTLDLQVRPAAEYVALAPPTPSLKTLLRFFRCCSAPTTCK